MTTEIQTVKIIEVDFNRIAFFVRCPYCYKIHKHGLGHKYKQKYWITSHCVKPGGSYEAFVNEDTKILKKKETFLLKNRNKNGLRKVSK